MQLNRRKHVIIWLVVIAFLVGGVGLIGLNQAGIFTSNRTEGQGPTTVATVEGTEITPQKMQQSLQITLANEAAMYQQYLGEDYQALLQGLAGRWFVLRKQAEVLQGLIRQAIYNSEAQKRGIKIPRSAIDAGYDQQYNQYLEQFTEAQLDMYVRRIFGITLEQFQTMLREDVTNQLRNKVLREQVVGVVDPSEDELFAYYEKNIPSYDQPEEIRASHILVGDEETAKDLRKQLNRGADFVELAREYSECPSAENGGDLDWFSRGQMVSEFEEVAFALEVNEISDVVETEFGYHIIKLTDRKEAHTPTLEEIRDQVVDDYTRDIGNERFDAWYEEVSTWAQIEVNLPPLAAFIKYQEGIDPGLEAFESLKDEGYEEDPYLPYYIGRLYEEKLNTAREEKSLLEEKEEKTEEELARIDELTGEINMYQTKATENYREIVRVQANGEMPPDEDFFQRVLALAPENEVTPYLYGKLLEERGDLVGAEMKFLEAIRNNPEYVEAYMASGDIAAKLSAFRRAINQYELALELEPGNVNILLKIADAYLNLEEYGEAADVLAEVQQMTPESLRLFELQGDLAYAKLQAAIEERDALGEKETLSEEEQDRLEEILQQIQKNYGEAVRAYNQVLARSGTADLYIKLGKTYLADGNFDEARDAFEDALVRSPYKADAYQGVGDILLSEGDIEGAVEKYKTAFDRSFDANQKKSLGETLIELVPDDVEMRFKLAKVYADQYMWSSVIKQYGIILEHDPESLEAHLGIAEAYKWRTEYDNALDYLDRALTLTTRPSVKIDIYNRIVEINRSQVGMNEPLTETGLGALFELAHLYMDEGDTELAKEQLERIQNDDSTYRAEEVTQLLAEIARTEEAVDDLSEGGVVQTPSSGL